MTISQAELQELRKRRDTIKGSYAQRNVLFKRYEEIYFMDNVEKPKGSAVDPNDWKITASPAGRDKVTGMKRILDTAEIHIKVKDHGEKARNSDKIEAGLKTMFRVSGEYKAARIEKDANLASVLYGPCVLTVDCIYDLLATKKGKDSGVDKYIVSQLKTIQKRTPFIIGTMNPKESYPEWGEYGLVGHLQEYTVKGSVLRERWGSQGVSDDRDYIVKDFFHYDKRLVEADGISTPLFADTWLTVTSKGEIEGVTSIPIFVRYAGGSTLFPEPEKQLQSFLYAYAKGEWDKRENLFWTYLFTAIYTQGLPGPTIVRDPDDTSDIKVNYTGGVKVITVKGKLENVQVIDSDVVQLKGLMDGQTNQSTIQEQTIGGNTALETFSSYVMQVNAGKLPLQDPREAIEFSYRDACLHILQRIKAEGIENELISPQDIPDDIDLEVTFEPNLTQDDLRNSQIVTQLKASGANVSDEWLNTNLLKIADSAEMFKQKTKEELRRAIVGNIVQNPEIMQQFIQAVMGQGQQSAISGQQGQGQEQGQMQPPTPPEMGANGEAGIPPEMMGMMQQGGGMPGMMPGAGGEAMPQTDAMIPPQERR